MYSANIYENDCELGASAWERAEARVREVGGGGFVAYAPPPIPEPPVHHISPQDVATMFPQRSSVRPAPAAQTTFVTEQPPQQKSALAILFPFVAVVVGIPFLIWVADRQREKELRA